MMPRAFLASAVLSLALAPVANADRFCDDVKRIVAASNEQPRPFMSLLKGPMGEVTGLGSTKLVLQGFGLCMISKGWYSQTAGRPWRYHCDARSGSSLRMDKIAADVRTCLGVDEVLREESDVELGMPGQTYTAGEQPPNGTPVILVTDRQQGQSYASIDFEVFRKE
jgi:hypothetical protein